MFPEKMTEEKFNEIRTALLNGNWAIRWKYPVNKATVKRIKKSKTFAEYAGPDGKYAKTDF